MSRKAILVIVALILVSPLFGIVGAELVGYHEPLDIAAKALGKEEAEVYWSPFPDYTIPGLPEDLVGLSIGYIISGAIGVSVILAIGLVLRKALESRGGGQHGYD